MTKECSIELVDFKESIRYGTYICNESVAIYVIDYNLFEELVFEFIKSKAISISLKIDSESVIYLMLDFKIKNSLEYVTGFLYGLGWRVKNSDGK